MPLRIRDISVVPSTDWSYYVGQTNFTVKTKNFYRAYPMIVEHCKSNNVTPPTEQEVIDDMCAKLNIPCYYSEDMQTPFINSWTLNLPKPARLGCCGH